MGRMGDLRAIFMSTGEIATLLAISACGTSQKCHGNFTMTAFGAEPDMHRARSFFCHFPTLQ